MTSYTRRAFLKLCALALPGLTILSKIPLPKPFNALYFQGRTFWVATEGKDSNPGTVNAPFETLDHAIDICNRRGGPAGDMIFVSGSHTISQSIPLDKSLTLVGLNDESGAQAMVGLRPQFMWKEDFK